MITLCRDRERRHLRRARQDVWSTIYPQEGPDRPVAAFGLLAALDEIRLPPGGVSWSHPLEEAEIVTYVHKGGLAQEDSSGGSGVIQAGEFQYMIIGRGVRQKESNASRSDRAHLFRIYLHRAQAGIGCAREQKRFPAAQRRNLLCVIASPDGRQGSLRILQDALIFASVLDPGYHLIHELSPARNAWLHVVCGGVSLQDIILTQGDGAGMTSESSVSFTAQENSEILLVDMGPAAGQLFAGGGIPEAPNGRQPWPGR